MKDRTEQFEASGSKNKKILVAGIIVCLLVFVLTLFGSQMFAWNEVGQVRERLDQTIADRELDENHEDCRQLYTGDLIMALGLSQMANNNMWISVGGRDAALTEEEQIEEAAANNLLADALEESNKPLADAVQALLDYTALDPRPQECPHPKWEDEPSDERISND